MNLLNLRDWQTGNYEDGYSRDYLIRAEYTVFPSACVHCGTVSEIQRFGTKQQRFKDLPVHATRVTILVIRQRYCYKACDGTFFQPLPDMD